MSDFPEGFIKTMSIYLCSWVITFLVLWACNNYMSDVKYLTIATVVTFVLLVFFGRRSRL